MFDFPHLAYLYSKAMSPTYILRQCSNILHINGNIKSLLYIKISEFFLATHEAQDSGVES